MIGVFIPYHRTPAPTPYVYAYIYTKVYRMYCMYRIYHHHPCPVLQRSERSVAKCIAHHIRTTIIP